MLIKLVTVVVSIRLSPQLFDFSSLLESHDIVLENNINYVLDPLIENWTLVPLNEYTLGELVAKRKKEVRKEEAA